MSQDRLKILLIEHDTGFARAAGEMLGRTCDLAVEVCAAEDLRSGMASLAGDHFDLVVCDLGVPDGAGLANVLLIRSEKPRIPIIVAGDVDDEAIVLESMHAGAQAYLVKSQLTPGWLERSIRHALERHRLDRAQLEAEEKYHSVFDHLVEGIFQTSPDGRYLMANAALARIYGYESPEDLISGLVDIGARLYVEEGRRDEFLRRMHENDELTGFESQVYRKDGSIIWISENCRAIRDHEGRLLFFEGSVVNISRRKEAEDRLSKSEALYHSLVETLPQNIFRKDLEGRFTFANQQFCRTLGRSLEDILGKTDLDFFPAQLAAKYREDDRKILASGVPYDQVEEHQPPGGPKMYVQVVKTPLYGAEGIPLGLQGIFWDITEQRNAQERLRNAYAQLRASRKELWGRNRQMEADLRMAREIQHTMLPQHYPAFRSGATQTASCFEFTHRYLPTESVGGDFFSVFAISETEAGLFLCDVAGHGVQAALVTGIIRALLEELKTCASDPGAFLTTLNRELCAILKHTSSPLLTTAVYAVANCTEGTLVYANAGHPKPLLLSRETAEVSLLSNPGTGRGVLGLFEAARYEAARTQLRPGDRLLLFTDGLVDLHGPQPGETFTVDHLVGAVHRHRELPTPRLLDRVLDEARRFCPGGFQDDVCVLGVDYRGPNA